MSEVRRMDSIVTNLFLNNEETQKKLVPGKAKGIGKSLMEHLVPMATTSFKIPSSGDLEDLCIRTIELKLQLLVSPLEYRIEFVRAGTQFEHERMVGEDVQGNRLQPSQCFGKRILACLFPSIAQRCAAVLAPAADVEDALMTNKHFMCGAGDEETTELSILLAKAVVLLT
jgi:hypothetical protein